MGKSEEETRGGNACSRHALRLAMAGDTHIFILVSADRTERFLIPHEDGKIWRRKTYLRVAQFGDALVERNEP
jgi:hypothetical protein